MLWGGPRRGPAASPTQQAPRPGRAGQAGHPLGRYLPVGTVRQFADGADCPLQPRNWAVFSPRCGAAPQGPRTSEFCRTCHGGGAQGWVAQRPSNWVLPPQTCGSSRSQDPCLPPKQPHHPRTSRNNHICRGDLVSSYVGPKGVRQSLEAELTEVPFHPSFRHRKQNNFSGKIKTEKKTRCLKTRPPSRLVACDLWLSGGGLQQGPMS